MITNIIGALANLTSLLLWIPQAKTTWRNRSNKQALLGVSIGTQIIVVINTVLWCVYGLMISNVWLPLGTIIILPLASITIFLKLKSKRPAVSEVDPNTWFTFAAYQKLSLANKKRCLKSIYTTDFSKQVSKAEFLNWESQEVMSDIDKMYWDKELWLEKIDGYEKGKEENH